MIIFSLPSYADKNIIKLNFDSGKNLAHQGSLIHSKQYVNLDAKYCKLWASWLGIDSQFEFVVYFLMLYFSCKYSLQVYQELHLTAKSELSQW